MVYFAVAGFAGGCFLPASGRPPGDCRPTGPAAHRGRGTPRAGVFGAFEPSPRCGEGIVCAAVFVSQDARHEPDRRVNNGHRGDFTPVEERNRQWKSRPARGSAGFVRQIPRNGRTAAGSAAAGPVLRLSAGRGGGPGA